MIDRKTLRDFMQNVMREKLFSSPEYSRDDVCKFFENFTGRVMSLEDKIELIQALKSINIPNPEQFEDLPLLEIETAIKQDTGTTIFTAYFNVDPVNKNRWTQFMYAIYQEEQE